MKEVQTGRKDEEGSTDRKAVIMCFQRLIESSSGKETGFILPLS